MTLDAYIEALLFFKGEALRIKKLSELLAKTPEEIEGGLRILEEKLLDRGIRLIRFEDEVTLGTASRASEMIEKISKEELSKDLGKAGLETLSIIIYRGPLSRREIDHIRGVNSQFIVRNLLIRGLIEKISSPKDERIFLYKPTLDLLAFLGVGKIEELPEFLRVREEIDKAKEEPIDPNDTNKNLNDETPSAQ